MTENEREVWKASLGALDDDSRVLLNLNDKIEEKINTSHNIQEIEELRKLSTLIKRFVRQLQKERAIIRGENPFHAVEVLEEL